MKCVKCSRNADIDMKHLGGSLCQACFSDVIEKRVRKAFREHGWLKPREKVVVMDDGTLKAKVSIYLLNSIFKGLPFYFIVKKGKIQDTNKLSKGYEKAIIPWNLDDEIELNLKAMFDGRQPEKMQFIKPLLNISDEEIVYFAKIKKIKGKMHPKTAFGKTLDELEKRYPGSKFGLLKSFV